MLLDHIVIRRSTTKKKKKFCGLALSGFFFSKRLQHHWSIKKIVVPFEQTTTTAYTDDDDDDYVNATSFSFFCVYSEWFLKIQIEKSVHKDEKKTDCNNDEYWIPCVQWTCSNFNRSTMKIWLPNGACLSKQKQNENWKMRKKHNVSP